MFKREVGPGPHRETYWVLEVLRCPDVSFCFIKEKCKLAAKDSAGKWKYSGIWKLVDVSVKWLSTLVNSLTSSKLDKYLSHHPVISIPDMCPNMPTQRLSINVCSGIIIIVKCCKQSKYISTSDWINKYALSAQWHTAH